MGKRFVGGVCVYQGNWWKLARPLPALGLHLLVVLAGSAWSLQRSARPLDSAAVAGFVAALLAGWLGWTLFEYLLHRWFLHHTRWKWLRRIVYEPLHREHHLYRTMNDPDAHTVHPAVTLPMALTLLGIVGAPTTSPWPLAGTVGLLLGYVSYETMHWVSHMGRPPAWIARTAYYRRLRAAHTVHHFRCATRNYGFITSVWDRVFGTFLELAPDAARTAGEPAPEPAEVHEVQGASGH